MGTGSSGTNFTSLTWVVNVQEDGVLRIRKCLKGFNHLVLSDVRSKYYHGKELRAAADIQFHKAHKLFEKWVQSQLWQNTLPIREVSMLTGSDGT
jgi:hypothetical protein